jgi:hypothetical protein
MRESTHPNDERVRILIPGDDPRFDGLRQYISLVRQRGRGSRVPQILAEWALLGYQLQTGVFSVGTAGSGMTVELPEGTIDPAEALRLQTEVQQDLDDLWA